MYAPSTSSWRFNFADVNAAARRSTPSAIPLSVSLQHWNDRNSLGILGKLTKRLYFCKYRNMTNALVKKADQDVAKFADMFSAMGTEPRLRIMQLLLSAHPDGLVVNEIQTELDIPNSTLSHHLDKLRNEDLVRVQRESTFLRYTANTDALQELLQFLYSECCTRNKAVRPKDVVQICR
jgi:ArsR family transcriptional regulator